MSARSEPHVAVANDLILTQVNSKLSHDIKKNDFSLSHMVKNYEGRKQFLRTIELVRMIITLDLDHKNKMVAERRDYGCCSRVDVTFFRRTSTELRVTGRECRRSSSENMRRLVFPNTFLSSSSSSSSSSLSSSSPSSLGWYLSRHYLGLRRGRGGG